MAQLSQVPQFGKWEGEQNVPYTAVFDNARKGEEGGKSNPNDLQDFPDSTTPGKQGLDERDTSQYESESRRSVDSPLPNNTMGQRTTVDSTHQRYGGAGSGGNKSEVEAPKGTDTLRVRYEHQLSREEGDLRKPTGSSLSHDPAVHKTSYESPRHSSVSAGDTPRRATRQNVGSGRSVDQSPLHPQSHARIGGKATGVPSPSWERKGSSEGSHGLAPSTPGQSRLRSVTRGDETPDHGPAVPKFGEWDDSDPASAEGYTQLFNRVREEKQTGAGKVPVMPTETSYTNSQRGDGYGNSKSCWCIPWGRR